MLYLNFQCGACGEEKMAHHRSRRREEHYDILRSAVLFYAMLCRALPCIAYPLGIIALLDIRLCE